MIEQLLIAAIGVGFKEYLLILTFSFSLVLLAFDARLSAWFLFLAISIQFLYFYLQGDYILHLYALIASLIYLSLSILLTQKYKIHYV